MLSAVAECVIRIDRDRFNGGVLGKEIIQSLKDLSDQTPTGIDRDRL